MQRSELMKGTEVDGGGAREGWCVARKKKKRRRREENEKGVV